MNPDEFQRELAAAQIKLDDHQMKQFETYYRLLVSTNSQVNLTALTAEKDVYLKHFYDSLTLAIYVPQLRTNKITLCDVGAGAGFPSIPLKIAFPQLEITIIDSLNKRIGFLTELIKQLDLTGVTLVHERAEIFGTLDSPNREKYDLVTARAVARLNVLSELCLPLVKLGGQFAAMKASQIGDELTQSETAIKILGGHLAATTEFKLPVTGDQRGVVLIDKIASTPSKYPRKAGTPNKKPLINQ